MLVEKQQTQDPGPGIRRRDAYPPGPVMSTIMDDDLGRNARGTYLEMNAPAWAP